MLRIPLGTLTDAPLPTLSCRLSALGTALRAISRRSQTAFGPKAKRARDPFKRCHGRISIRIFELGNLDALRESGDRARWTTEPILAARRR
jgi:hypothetical protein